VAPDQTTLTDDNIQCNQRYSYRISSISEEGSSGYSNIAQGIAQCAELRKPDNFAAKTGDSAIILEWDNSNDAQDGIIILRWNWVQETWEELATVDGQTTRYEDSTDLEYGQTYSYIIRAVSQERLSPPTEYQSAPAPALLLHFRGPSKASTEAITNGTIELSWQDNSDNEDGYMVARYNVQTGEWEEVATLAADSTSYQDSGLTCDEDQQYHYQVFAQREGVHSSLSNQASSTACATDDIKPEFTPTMTPMLTPTAASTLTPTVMSTSTPPSIAITSVPTATSMATPTPDLRTVLTLTPALTADLTSDVDPTPNATPTITPVTISTATPVATLDLAEDEESGDTNVMDTLRNIFLPIINK